MSGNHNTTEIDKNLLKEHHITLVIQLSNLSWRKLEYRLTVLIITLIPKQYPISADCAFILMRGSATYNCVIPLRLLLL